MRLHFIKWYRLHFPCPHNFIRDKVVGENEQQDDACPECIFFSLRVFEKNSRYKANENQGERHHQHKQCFGKNKKHESVFTIRYMRLGNGLERFPTPSIILRNTSK